MIRVRVLCAPCILALVLIGARIAGAQPDATGPVADLNAAAKAASETEPDRSLAIALRAQAAASAAGDVRGEAEALNYIAYAYRNQSLLDIARRHAENSVGLYAGVGDAWGEAQGYNTLGLIEADAGRFPEALEFHLKALAIRERTGDEEGLAYSYNNLGNAYRNMGQYDQALAHHQRALALKVALGMKPSEAYSHQNIGLVHFELRDYQRALESYRRALSIREQLNDHRAMGVSLNAIAQVEALTAPAASLRTYERVLALRRETGDERGEMATHLSIGAVHQGLGNQGPAVGAFERALAIGGRIDAPLMRSNAHKALADVEAARGDYRAAYAHQLEYQTERERMFSRENAERFQRLQVAHDADRRQRQIQSLEQEGALRAAELARARVATLALAATSALVFVTLALLAVRYRLKRRSEARFKAQAAELADALDRVKTLRGLLPICAWCKNIRDDEGYWTRVEAYVTKHSAATFTHSICPSCATEHCAQDDPGMAAAAPSGS